MCVCGVVHEKAFKQFRFKEGDRVVFAEDDRHVGRVLADQSLAVRGQHTMRFLLIGQNRSIFIGNLGLFWIYFDRIIGNA